eukprot:gene20929-22983_t
MLHSHDTIFAEKQINVEKSNCTTNFKSFNVIVGNPIIDDEQLNDNETENNAEDTQMPIDQPAERPQLQAGSLGVSLCDDFLCDRPRSRIYINGEAESFSIWETRFTNYLYTLDKGIHDAITAEEEGDNFEEYNRRAYAELVQVLDERSLQLVLNDAANDGQAAFQILKNHYASIEKRRVLTLHEELTTIKMGSDEDITDYIIRTERAAMGLRTAGDTITENLLIAMTLKGPPESYKSFVVVHMQLDKYKTLTEFKAALNNYANIEALRSPTQSSAMTNKVKKQSKPFVSHSKQENIQCLSCGKMGHKSRDCRSKINLKCHFCQKSGHVESVCFEKRQSSVQVSTVTSDFTSDFSFTTSNTIQQIRAVIDYLWTVEQHLK